MDAPSATILNTDKDKHFTEDRISYLLGNGKQKTSIKMEFTPPFKSSQLILQF